MVLPHRVPDHMYTLQLAVLYDHMHKVQLVAQPDCIHSWIVVADQSLVVTVLVAEY